MESFGEILKKVETKYRRPAIKNGFTKVSNSIITSTEITFNEKMVYICLRMHKMSKEVAFPSFTTLAEELGCSRRTIANCIKELLSKGIITREKRFYRSNRYSFPDFKF